MISQYEAPTESCRISKCNLRSSKAGILDDLERDFLRVGAWLTISTFKGHDKGIMKGLYIQGLTHGVLNIGPYLFPWPVTTGPSLGFLGFAGS